MVDQAYYLRFLFLIVRCNDAGSQSPNQSTKYEVHSLLHSKVGDEAHHLRYRGVFARISSLSPTYLSKINFLRRNSRNLVPLGPGWWVLIQIDLFSTGSRESPSHCTLQIYLLQPYIINRTIVISSHYHNSMMDGRLL